MSFTRRLAGITVFGTALIASLPVLAQPAAFPSKPIRIIVP